GSSDGGPAPAGPRRQMGRRQRNAPPKRPPPKRPRDHPVIRFRPIGATSSPLGLLSATNRLRVGRDSRRVHISAHNGQPASASPVANHESAHTEITEDAKPELPSCPRAIRHPVH